MWRRDNLRQHPVGVILSAWARLDSFLVTNKPVTPSAGPSTINSARAPGGRSDMVLPWFYGIFQGIIEIHRYAIHGDQTERLRLTVKQN